MGEIRVRGLGKAYKRYARKSGRVLEWLGASKRHELRWVLRNFTFDIAAGEAVGIVGPNGAGKSTLLKLIAATAQASEGTVETRGTVAALLELGVGFHPDFTGRENVYMAGSIRGLSADEIYTLMPGIEAFAEIGDYLDLPVRTYSSGMQMRLAFSISTIVRPDILIVDEALSVGDIYFQQKCFDRIREFRDAGTTLLFVSHSLASVYALCSRAIYIDGGRMQLDGSPKEVLDFYQAQVVARTSGGAGLVVDAPGATRDDAPLLEAQPLEAPPDDPRGTTGSYRTPGVAIERVAIFDAAGKRAEVVLSDQPMEILVTGRFERAVDEPHFGFQVRDRMGQALFMTTTYGLGVRVGPVAPGDSRTVRFRMLPRLAPGQYTVTAGIANRGRLDGTFEESLVRRQDIASFTIVDPVDGIRWGGVVNLAPTVEIDPLR